MPSEPTLDDVRREIDRIDHEIVRLLAARGEQVRRAGALKASVADVEAPARVERVVANVRRLAAEVGADPDLVERVYRIMIAAFIEAERAQVRERGGA